MNRVYLMFFILLSSVFASQNAFSGLQWVKEFMDIKYDQKTRIVKFTFVFYENTPGHLTDGYLKRCNFKYSENNKDFTLLMGVGVKSQMDDQETEITFMGKKPGQKIIIYDNFSPHGLVWFDKESQLKTRMSTEVKKIRINGKQINALLSIITVEWMLSTTAKPIKSIKLEGVWNVLGAKSPNDIQQLYFLVDEKKKSTEEKDIPLELDSEISNDAKVVGETDGINVTGAVAGQNIEIYTNEGVAVKSVVANNDVVNIKLPKNKKYIVKIGKVSYKVAL